MMGSAGFGCSEHPLWDSRRLWSLWDMINFHLYQFWRLWVGLHWHLETIKKRSLGKEQYIIPEAERKEIESFIEELYKFLSTLYLGGSIRTIHHLKKLYGREYSYNELIKLLERLPNDIEDDTKPQFFFHYQEDMALLLLNREKKWDAVLKAFESVKPEIEAGIDCYAIGHNTACIFHMMRIAEFGLRAIAKERGVKSVGKKTTPIEWATWGQVISEIEKTITEIRNTKPAGLKKDTALAFYTTIVSDLRALLHNYRDKTMHFREFYDSGEAESAIFRVHSLMATLASKITEDSARKIPWLSWA